MARTTTGIVEGTTTAIGDATMAEARALAVESISMIGEEGSSEVAGAAAGGQHGGTKRS